MKLKLLHNLILIDILTGLLIAAILLVPESWARIVLGLPFLLFFPGFVLVEALFVKRHDQPLSSSPSLSSSPFPEPKTYNLKPKTPSPSPDTSHVERPTSNTSNSIERVALSFGMSLAVTALIGLGLNYTGWGIRLLSVLYSITAFIVILSAVALFRQYRLNGRVDWLRSYTLKMPGWEGSAFNKALTVVLVIAILSVVGALIYAIVTPKNGERFTEFYILGLMGKADDYPSQFVWDDAQQTTVSTRYGQGANAVPEDYGRVTLGIVNQEQQSAAYAVELRIDNQTADLQYQGQSLARLEGIRLDQGQKWENQIGFAPQHPGPNQKVEFLLYKDNAPAVYNTLHLWVDVVGQ
jgi:uncharacterized membrane protein